MIFINTAHAATALENLTAGLDAIYRYSISIGGILAFGIIVFAGIEYIISAGNIARQQDAKSRIFNAVLGLIILLGAVIISRGIPGLLKFTDIKRASGPSAAKTSGFKLVLSAREEAMMAEAITKLVDETSGDVNRLKTILADIKNQYQNSYIRNRALKAYFLAIDNKGWSVPIFNSLPFNEKLELLESYRRAEVIPADIAHAVKQEDVYPIYKGLGDIGGDSGFFANTLLGKQLGGLFITFIETKEIPESDLEIFLRALNVGKMVQMYENSAPYKDSLRDYFTKLNLLDVNLLK